MAEFPGSPSEEAVTSNLTKTLIRIGDHVRRLNKVAGVAPVLRAKTMGIVSSQARPPL